MKIYLIILILFFSLKPLSANNDDWVINKDHSEIFFEIPYLTVATVTGRLKRYHGHANIQLSPQINFQNIFINIESASLDTGNKKRDHHIKSNHFLKTKKFPIINFKSQKITNDNHHHQAQGELTIKGISKKVTISFESTDPIKDTWGYQSIFIKFHLVINRKDFHINWDKFYGDNQYLIGNQIKVKGSFQLQQKSQQTPGTKHLIPDTKYIRLHNQYSQGKINKKQLEKQTVRKVKITTPQKSEKVVKKKTTAKLQPQPKNPSLKKKTLSWWVAYIFIGLTGFYSFIYLLIKVKFYFLNKWKEKYQENNFLGILSDLIIFSLFIMYSWSIWYLGFS